MGLPLRMDNIHAPTVPSGPSSQPLTNGGGAQYSFAELQSKKDDMEAELKALSGVLDSVGSAECALLWLCYAVRFAEIGYTD